MMGMMGGRGGRGGRGGAGATTAEGATAPVLTPIQKATQDLQTALEAEEVSTDDIKVKLAVLRKAREKDAQELAKARQSLRGVLKLKQEAQLVLMGMLD